MKPRVRRFASLRGIHLHTCTGVTYLPIVRARLRSFNTAHVLKYKVLTQRDVSTRSNALAFIKPCTNPANFTRKGSDRFAPPPPPLLPLWCNIDTESVIFSARTRFRFSLRVPPPSINLRSHAFCISTSLMAPSWVTARTLSETVLTAV